MNTGTELDNVEAIDRQQGVAGKGAERRGPRRFSLSLDMKIVEISGQPVIRMARTRDLSSGGGVSFLCDEPLGVGSIVRYFITLSAPPQLVRLAGAGHIVRCVEHHPDAKGEAFEAAVTMESYHIERE